jgi:ribonuclease HI
MFYAIRKGHKKGLLTNKEAFELSIKDYPDPEYREFLNMVDAMRYLSGKDIKEKKELLTSQPIIKNLKDDFNHNKKEIYYGVRVGRQPGIYKTWIECLEQIKSFPNNQFKKFLTKRDAENYVNNNLIDVDYDNNYDDTVLNVYTDGAVYHNGKPDCKASYGVYFNENDERNESGLVKEKPSSNAGELTGILRAIQKIKDDEETVIHTDSTYGIRCVSEYGMQMKKEGYPKEIPNIKLIKSIRELLEIKTNIRFHHLNSHTNKTDKHSICNAIVDKMATDALLDL